MKKENNYRLGRALARHNFGNSRTRVDTKDEPGVFYLRGTQEGITLVRDDCFAVVDADELVTHIQNAVDTSAT